MKIDGRAIAAKINETTRKRVGAFEAPPTLALLVVGESPQTASFLKIKKKTAEALGIGVSEVHLERSASQDEVEGAVEKLLATEEVDAIVVQLPLGEHIDTDAVVNLLPKEKDPDVLGRDAREKQIVLAPVLGAVKEILERSEVVLQGKQVLVVGQGRLVGAPISSWLKGEGIEPVVADEHTNNLSHLTKKADIIISGAGMPHLITPDMIQKGVVLIDAGTSSSGGALKGDVHPDCYEKAALYTPVPGGVGPVTVAKLFENVVALYSLKG